MFRRFFFCLSSIGKPDNVRGRHRRRIREKSENLQRPPHKHDSINSTLSANFNPLRAGGMSETEREGERENQAGGERASERAKFLHQNYANESLESSFSAGAKLLS
jgi:hypothetical protein